MPDRKRATRTSAVVARVLLAGVVLLLAYAVLLPSNDHEGLRLIERVSLQIAGLGLPHAPVFWAVETTANVAMFVPLGVLLPIALQREDRRALILTVLAGGLLSAAIELSQMLIPGRVSDMKDIVTNTLGALVGVLLVVVVRRLRSA